MDHHQAPDRNDELSSRPDLPEPPSGDEAPLSLGAWLKRHGTSLLLIGALLVFLINRLGLEGLGYVGMVALGLGFVVFIHELGHFAVAKWCDVHVETFSIGFGPPLPGCSFRRGETLYKIALIPLGGYVKMVGEGTSQADDDDPRSFKNKPVGQRMAIISAGVVMNVVLACVCFIAVYTHGKERQPAVVGLVEPGGPLWKKGVPSGAEFTQVGDKTAQPGHPLYFQEIQRKVLFSGRDEELTLAYLPPGGDQPRPPLKVKPQYDAGMGIPRLAFAAADTTQLISERQGRTFGKAFLAQSPAAAARKAFPFRKGDAVIQVTDPDNPEAVRALDHEVVLGDAESQRLYGSDLAKAWQRLAGSPMALVIRRQAGADGGTRKETVRLQPPAEFQFNDVIIATSDPDNPDEIKGLPADPYSPEGGLYDSVELHRRLRLLADQFVVIRVRRAGGEEADLMLPPSYHKTLGVRMKMGEVAAVREGSPAEKAELRPGDVLQAVILVNEATGDSRTFAATPLAALFLASAPAPDVVGLLLAAALHAETVEQVDPVRLPFDLQKWVARQGKAEDVKAEFVVSRDGKRVHLPARVPWDERWRFDRARPLFNSAPMAINELGIAYRVQTTVEHVSPDPKNELKAGDVIKKVRFITLDPKTGKAEEESWNDVEGGHWPAVFYALQSPLVQKVNLQVKRGDETVELTVEELKPDRAWPLAERGLIFKPATQMQRADNLLQAIAFGMQDTYGSIREAYANLVSMIQGRISPKNMAGPITIARVAYRFAGMDAWEFLFFIGVISINLAVVNFLPIPVLDGGHMVFLIYEKLRGKPASEKVQIGATVIGLTMILSLMAFVIYLDISRL